MTYAAGEVLILAQIRATTNFDKFNTSQGDWTILGKGKGVGKGKSYCILIPAPFDRGQDSLGSLGVSTTYLTTWQTKAQVWVHLKLYKDTSLALQARRQEIIDRIDAWPHLADTLNVVQDAIVRSGGEITEMSRKNVPVYYMQELLIEWKEESNVTLQE